MKSRRRDPMFRGALVDLTKLRDYCLSSEHPRGRHKARVFRSRLGLTASDAELLRSALLDAAQRHRRNLIHAGKDVYGQRFFLDFEMTTEMGTTIIRSGWIVPTGEQVIRFITCYVLS
jgi:hypothetical protein